MEAASEISGALLGSFSYGDPILGGVYEGSLLFVNLPNSRVGFHDKKDPSNVPLISETPM